MLREQSENTHTHTHTHTHKEDWLNRYEERCASDHRFVYLGPAGSVTPLHTDTLHSYSWTANVAGCKR